MRLLITGGTGFFGKALLRHWQDAALSGRLVPQITVLSRNPERFIRQFPEFESLAFLSWHQGDILVPDSFPKFDGFTHVLHAAADSSHGVTDSPIKYFDQIVMGTRNLLDYAVNNNIKKFLFVSSGGVYGTQPMAIKSIPETYNGMADPLQASNAYSVAKRCAEHLCGLYDNQYGLQSVIARCFSFVGRDLPMDAHFAIGNFIRDALCADKIVVKGNGTPVRSYMDQRDLAIWLEALLNFGQQGQAYNVGSKFPISISDLAFLVRDTLSPKKNVYISSGNSDEKARLVYVPDTLKIEKTLGVRLNYTLQESIRDAALFFKL